MSKLLHLFGDTKIHVSGENDSLNIVENVFNTLLHVVRETASVSVFGGGMFLRQSYIDGSHDHALSDKPHSTISQRSEKGDNLLQ